MSSTRVRRRGVAGWKVRVLCCLHVLAGVGGCTGDGAPLSRWAAADTASWAMDTSLVRVGGAGQEWDRVYAGILRRDGSIVIANSGTAQLRFIDSDGRSVRTAGRNGAGPGEFGSINWMDALPGDSLVAFDMRLQRFSVWSPAGVFQRVFTTHDVPGQVRPIGVLHDGTVLAAIDGQYDPRGGAGVVRDSMQVLRMGPGGEVLQTLGGFPGAEWLIYEHPTSFRATQLPFGRSGHLAATGSHFVYGSSESGQLTVYDPSGRLVRTIQLGLRPRPLSRDEVSASLGEIQDRAEHSALERHYRQGSKGSAPVLTALRGDRQGNLWVRLSPPPGADSVKWVVVTLEGERIGSVRMHTAWLPLDIRDSVLLRESDADGVQRVAVRKVVK